MADSASGEPAKPVLETMVSYSGEGALSFATFDVALFRELNAEFADKPVVPAPRVHDTSYTTSIGQRRAAMLHRKIGLDGLRVLEIGCGDGMLSRVLAGERGCQVVGVDVSSYPSWNRPFEGDLTQIVHDVSARSNEALGLFDRVVSFAVFEHVIHPYNALAAAFDMLRPGGKAYIYANLYRGAKASHRYREVFFPWPHLLFQASVWREFYRELKGEPMQAAWVNKLTYDQYVAMAGRIGFRVADHFPSPPYFDEAFYERFEYELSAYPRFDLMHDFIHLVLEKPGEGGGMTRATPRPAVAPPKADPAAETFWRNAATDTPQWLVYRARWDASRRDGASALDDAQPWVTFAAIDFLDGVLGKSSRVFEWGSGGSTVFFAKRAGSVRSVEHDGGWRDATRDRLSALPNAQSELIAPESRPPSSYKFASGAKNCSGLDFETYVNAIRSEPDEAFDVILVDGRARLGCLEEALPKVAPGGWLMLDNSDYPRYAARLAELRAGALAGWREIALAGPGPYSRTHAWTTTAWRKPAGLKLDSAIANMAFADGGRWFVKGPSVDLAQNVSFDSRAHQQAVAGAFRWRDCGVDILVDPSRHIQVDRTEPKDPAFRDGLQHTDELRRYVESTSAHNTLSIDGPDHPRFRSAPTGSGFVSTARSGDVFACETTIANLPRITHFRIVLLKPGSWLVCLDGVRSRDGVDHDVTQHFCLHPDWAESAQSPKTSTFRHGAGLDLHVTPVFAGAAITDVARGRGDPKTDRWQDLAGWWSPKHMAFEPCTSLSVTARGQSLVMATLLTFEPARIDESYCAYNVTQRQIRLRWRSAGKVGGVIITRDGDTPSSTRLKELKLL